MEVEECKRETVLKLEEDQKAAEMQWELEKLREAERHMVEEIRRAQASLLRMVEAMEVNIEDGGDGENRGRGRRGKSDDKEGKEGGWMGDHWGVLEVQDMPERGHTLYNQFAPDRVVATESAEGEEVHQGPTGHIMLTMC